MTVFNVIEKQQRSRFIAFRFFTEIIVAKPKVNITLKFLFVSRAELQLSWSCLDFKHHCYIASWEIARIFDSVSSCSHSFHIYTKSTATLTYHGNFALVVIRSGDKFQNIPWLVKKFVSSRVPKVLRFGAAIFQVPRATSQIHKSRTSPYSLL